MRILRIEPHYLGCLEYFVLIDQATEIQLDLNVRYTKQSYKNRCYILTSQGKQALTVPVKFTNYMAVKDVKIDYSQSWLRQHWGAVYSAYGKSPFYEYFVEYFKQIWDKKPQFLVDMNLEFLTICLKLLQSDRPVSVWNDENQNDQKVVWDMREQIHPKIAPTKRKYYQAHAYNQNFGHDFVDNLSILDLLFSEGPAAGSVLKYSDAREI